MKRWAAVICGMWIAALFAQATAPLVPYPLETAYERARAEGKPLLVAFLGTGWSLASDKFRERVLESAEFEAFAAEALIWYPVHARRKPKLSKAETATLQSMVIHFDVMAYPVILFLGPDGTEWLRHGYLDTTAGEYVESLRALMPPPQP